MGGVGPHVRDVAACQRTFGKRQKYMMKATLDHDGRTKNTWDEANDHRDIFGLSHTPT